MTRANSSGVLVHSSNICALTRCRISGERIASIGDPDARGVIAGLTLSHTRGDLYRAALEASNASAEDRCHAAARIAALTGTG